MVGGYCPAARPMWGPLVISAVQRNKHSLPHGGPPRILDFNVSFGLFDGARA
jgi:hypothetical protein